MRAKSHRGFTIMETALFVGLSGLLLIALTANQTKKIAVQRYEDSVDSLANFLKDVYTSVLNPENNDEAITYDNTEVTGRKTCTTKSDSADIRKGQPTSVGTFMPGTTSCTTYGKLIAFGSEPIGSDLKNTVYVFDLVGDTFDHSNPFPGKDSSGDLKSPSTIGPSHQQVLPTELFDAHVDYRVKSNGRCTSAGQMQKYTPEWDAEIYDDSMVNKYKGFVVIARSPADGRVSTYYQTITGDFKLGNSIGAPTCPTSGQDNIEFYNRSSKKTSFIQDDLQFCIKSEDQPIKKQTQAIMILENGQNPSAVKTLKEEEACS